MKSWAKWTAKVVVFTTGFAAAGGGLAGAAFAGTGTSSTGNTSAVSGNQVSIPVSLPANVCGNAAALLGFATASCQGGASVTGASATAGAAPAGGKGNVFAGGPNVVVIPVQAALDACGNAVGNATAHCPGGVSLPGGGTILAGGAGGTGNTGIASGNKVSIPVTVPVNVCGNAVAVLGDSSAGCEGGASVGIEPQKAASTAVRKAPARHTAKASGHKKTRNVKAKTAAHPLKPVQAAALGTVPAVTNVLGLVQPLLHQVPLLNGEQLASAKHGTAKLPVSTLSALQASVAGQPMSDNSLTALAVGALLAGAAAVKVAGRGARTRKEASEEVSA